MKNFFLMLPALLISPLALALTCTEPYSPGTSQNALKLVRGSDGQYTLHFRHASGDDPNNPNVTDGGTYQLALASNLTCRFNAKDERLVSCKGPWVQTQNFNGNVTVETVAVHKVYGAGATRSAWLEIHVSSPEELELAGRGSIYPQGKVTFRLEQCGP
jgi:hypothetical protein